MRDLFQSLLVTISCLILKLGKLLTGIQVYLNIRFVQLRDYYCFIDS